MVEGEEYYGQKEKESRIWKPEVTKSAIGFVFRDVWRSIFLTGLPSIPAMEGCSRCFCFCFQKASTKVWLVSRVTMLRRRLDGLGAPAASLLPIDYCLLSWYLVSFWPFHPPSWILRSECSFRVKDNLFFRWCMRPYLQKKEMSYTHGEV